MNVKPEDLQRAPGLSDILSQAEGGIPAVIAAMRFSDDTEVQGFLEAYDKATNSDREIVPLEAFALAADVDPVQLLGAAILALQNQCANIVKVIAITSHPATMRARVQNALMPGGYRDRNALDTALRFLPQPKGATTIIMPGAGAVVQNIEPGDVDTESLFPDLAETQKLLTGE